MKRRFGALTLSLVLGITTGFPAYASDFLDDTEAYVYEIGEMDDAGSTIEPAANETETDTVSQEIGIVEDPIDEMLAVEVFSSEEPGDFYEEVTMSDLYENETEEADAADILEEESIETGEQDFAEIPVVAELSSGWEERIADGQVKYLRAKGSYNTAGMPEYYTSADGIVTIDGKQYAFDANGYMITGRMAYRNRFVFFMPADSAVKVPGAVGEPNPSNSNLGQMQKAYWYWDGKAFSYYASTGFFASIADIRASKMKAGTFPGYFKVNGCYFILKDNGVPRTGDYEVKEGTRPGLYYLYPEKNEKGYPGEMAIDTWVNVKNSKGSRWRYYDKSGRTKLGVKATKLDTSIKPSVRDYTYLLTEGGYVYKEAVIRKAADGYSYACNAKGIVQKDKLFTYKGARYYVDAKGRVASWTNSWHWLKSCGNRPYYFGSTPGKISEKKGWIKIVNGTSYKWYYFTANGNAATEGFRGNYYFDSNCALVTGLKTINGKTYFFRFSDAENHNGSMYKKTLIQYQGKEYYAGADGVLYRSKWVTIGGNDYYFQSDGTKAKNCFAKHGDKYGYLDSEGKFTVGWIIANANANQIRYVNTQAAGYVKNDYRIIDGVRYYFDSDGYRVSDLTSYYPSNWKSDPVLTKLHNGGYAPYYLECDKTNGVITVYTDSSKAIPVKSIRTSVGNPTTLTPSGNYPLTRASRWQPLMGPSWGQYGTHVVQGIFIHSVACNAANSYNLPASAYDMLGSPASHGCMRVCVADAKWVYDNCNGGRITIFYGGYQEMECFKGPLGRKPLVPRYGSGNFDPTDPAV